MTEGAPEGYTVPFLTLERIGRGDAAAGRRALRAMIDLEIVRQPVNGPTERPAGVRAAVPGDEDGIMALARMEIEEVGRTVAPVSETKLLAMVRAAVRGEATIGVIDGPEGIVAMTFLVPHAWWWSDQWFIQEMFSFVHPAHRKSRHWASMIKFSRWFADSMSERLGYQVFLLSGITSTVDVRAKMAASGRLLNYVGGFFMYPQP